VTVPVLGFDFFAGTIEGAAEAVIDRALSGEGGYACLTGVHGITTARRDTAHYDALTGAWMNFPDGMPVAWRQWMGGARPAGRVGGPDLMPKVIELGQGRKVRHYLLGSTDEVLDRLTRALDGRYPKAIVAGTYSPPFRALSPDEEDEMVQLVRTARPHIVWVGLGAPKQDLWMARHAPLLDPALCMGVGAAFDFISGTKPRAPSWMRSAGLEWVHRVSKEPRRLAPRYLQSNSRFVVDNTRDIARRLRGRPDTVNGRRR
jgi:N-acetylglucosaminyldiphosphoundecaprenol N-acetyl-beta-D-mannosaminyltransferase